MKYIRLILSSFVFLILSTSSLCQNGWYILEAKSFSIEFPKKPEAQIQTVKSALGELKMEISMYDGSKDSDENHLYGIATSEYPDSILNSGMTEKLDTFFRASIDGVVNNVQGKLLSEKNIEIQKFPGREIRVDFRNGLAIILMRFYLIYNKMFIIQTITETSKELNQSVLRFQNSFKLK